MEFFWWLKHPRYFFYMLREFTGPVIALFTGYFLVRWFFDPALSFVQTTSFHIVSWIVFVFSVIHSITWFFVTAKIAPLPDRVEISRSLLEKLVFLLLLFVWFAVSFFLSIFFYYAATP